jgi:CheY-like chemotaxis protein
MPMKVLVVEDNELNLDILTRRLQRKGYDVITAKDGQEGVACAKTNNPDIILMDVSLPLLDGYDATRQIKADQNTKNIPIIILTAHAMVGDREKALASGCDEYETKPVDFSHLLEKIEKLLKKT